MARRAAQLVAGGSGAGEEKRLKAVSSDKKFFEWTARSFGNILDLGANGNWAGVEVVR